MFRNKFMKRGKERRAQRYGACMRSSEYGLQAMPERTVRPKGLTGLIAMRLLFPSEEGKSGLIIF